MSETRSVETTAPDIEAAIELGLEKLGVSRESVIVEILEEPSRGLLGLGARQARIRLTTAAPARGAAPGTSAPPAAAPDTASRTVPAEDAEEVASRAGAPYDQAPYDEDLDEDEDVDAEADEDADEDEAYEGGEYDAPETSAPEEELDDDARVGRATLEELLAKMKIDARINLYRAPAADRNEDPPWVLQVQGDDLAILIGRRGETLSALQYITRLIASRDLQRRANIVLDVEGYKSRRERVLRGLAARMADQAVQIGRTVALEPMPPYERRIVHLALRERDDVTTESVGEGNFRKVTIIPRRR